MFSPRYHSQCQEDRWILDNLKPEPGFFVEVGAFDGIQSSNTLAFEDLGWTGLLIEADPFTTAQCVNNRKSPTMCCAIGEVSALSRLTEFHINPADHGLSGIASKGNPLIVPVVRLYDAIGHVRPYEAGKVDLLSIDTEGTELEVWSSLGPIRPRIVIIEYQTCDNPPNDERIIHQMTMDGYQTVHRTMYNLIFTYGSH